MMAPTRTNAMTFRAARRIFDMDGLTASLAFAAIYFVAAAASIAAPVVSLEAMATWRTTRPVAGLVTGSCRSPPATSLPLMK